MESGKLIKKSSLYLIGNLSSKVLYAILVPLYAFYVSIDDLGAFDYAQTLMNIFMPFLYMAIWEAILKYVLQEKEIQNKKKILSNSIFFTFCISLVLLVIFTATFIITFKDTNIIRYTLIMMITHALGQIWQYYARSLEENKVYVVASISGTIINFILVIILVCILDKGLLGLSISYSLGQLFIMIFIESKLRIVTKCKVTDIDFSLLKKMMCFAFPIVLNLTSLWIMNGFNRVIILNTLGIEANGLYAFVSKFTVVVSTFGSVISMALIEESIIRSGDKKIGKYFSNNIEKIFAYFLILSILVMPIIFIFYYFIANTPYYSSKMLFPWFILYAIFMSMSTNIGAVFQATDKTKYIFYTTIVGMIVTISTSYVLIYKLGLLGAAFSQIIGACSMMIVRYIFAKSLCDIKLKKQKLVILMGVYIIEAISCNFISPVYLTLIIIINIIIMYFFMRKDLFYILKKIKNR